MSKTKTTTKHERLTVGIDQLYANDYNSNHMPEKKFEALVDTIRRNGQTHPIQVVKDTKGKFRIVGGEHKWRAMKLLKFKDVEILIRNFEDDVEEKLSSIEDNIHGSAIPVKEAMIIASATKKYPINKLEKRLGESTIDLRDKLLLVDQEDKMKKIQESINGEHTVELDFIVDADPKGNADRFIAEISRLASKLGAKLEDSKIKLSKSHSAIALLTFNVSDLQKKVIEKALNNVQKSESVGKARALELVCGNFLNDPNFNENSNKVASRKTRT